MARRFLPALRGLQNTSLQPAPPSGPSEPLEGKGFSLDSPTLNAYISGRNISSGFGGQDRAAGWDWNRAVESYERSIWTFKCVNYISGHFARLPFAVAEHRGTTAERILDEHPLHRVMNKRANPAETGQQFRKRLSAQLLLSKRGVFVEVTKSRAGTIVRLDLLAPDRCRPMPNLNGGDDYIDYYQFFDRNGTLREIDPERIRWIRDPHPDDPYSSVTPLEAAGMSVQLDMMSRHYNVNFMQNDGRPGGIVGFDADGLTDDELDRVERKFQPGVSHAGKITVLGTGPGGLDYVDTSTKPRDMSYAETATNAKNEILSAFGLGESLFGNSSGRSFDNAEQEKYNAWSETLLPHFALGTSAFDGDLDDWETQEPFIDTRTVDVLEIPRRKRREEALQEWNAGLRSVNEYRPMAGLAPLDSAFARAVWISPSKAPVPGKPGDEAALGLQDPNAAVPGAPGVEQPGGPGPAQQAVAEARGDAPAAGPAALAVAAARGELPEEPVGPAADAVAEARSTQAGSAPGEAAEAVAAARESKTLHDGPLHARPAAAVQDRLETALAGAFDSLLSRQAEIIVARVESPKVRKGTRFWAPDGDSDVRGGGAVLDSADVMQSARWQEELEQTVRPLAAAAGLEVSAAVLGQIAAAGALAGQPADLAEVHLQPSVDRAVATATGALTSWIGTVQRALEVDMLTAEHHGQLVDTVRAVFSADGRRWATDTARHVAAHAVNGTTVHVGGLLAPLPDSTGELAEPDAVWEPAEDCPLHSAGSTVGSDAFTSPQECRCVAQVRVSRTARLLLPPPPAL